VSRGTPHIICKAGGQTSPKDTVLGVRGKGFLFGAFCLCLFLRGSRAPAAAQRFVCKMISDLEGLLKKRGADDFLIFAPIGGRYSTTATTKVRWTKGRGGLPLCAYPAIGGHTVCLAVRV